MLVRIHGRADMVYLLASTLATAIFAAALANFKSTWFDRAILVFIIVYHFLFSIVFLWYSDGIITDSFNYFSWAASGAEGAWYGTGLIVSIVRAIQYLGFKNYESIFMFFSAVSGFSVASLYLAIVNIGRQHGMAKVVTPWVIITLLLPGLHFWTVPIGKDGLILFSYALVVMGIYRGGGKFILLSAVVLAFLVRPHVGFAMGALLLMDSYRNITLFKSWRQRVLYKVVIFIVAIFVGILFYKFVLSFIQRYSDVGFGSILEFLESRQGIYAESGSGFDLAAYSFPVRYILFFLGGVPGVSTGLFQFFAMMEGLFVILVMTLIIYYLYRGGAAMRRLGDWRHGDGQSVIKKFKRLEIMSTSLLFYSLALAAGLTLITGNFGLIARQRIMVYVPLVVSMFLAYFVYRSVTRIVRYGGLAKR